MTTLETYEICEIVTQNVYEYDEWYDYFSHQMGATGQELLEKIKYIEDASYLRNLYYDFFESSYNSYVEDSD